MTQQTLNFHPSTRRDAPKPSHDAAARAKFSARSVSYKVLSCLGDGMPRTDEQIYADTGSDPMSSTPRVRRSDMVRMGLIEARDENGKSSSGCSATRWAITGKGLDVLAGLDKDNAA